MNNKKNISIAIALAVVIFIIDLRTPVGYADWLLYFIPVFVAAPALGRIYIPILSAAATLLIIMDYFFSPAGGNLMGAVANRGLGILVLWWISFIIMKRKQAEEALARSYRGLEQRVKDRTEELRQVNTSLTAEISERTLTEEALRASEQHYRILFDTMLQGVVYQDADGKFKSMNPAAEQILGKSREEMLGQTSASLGHDTIREDGTPFPGREHPAIVALQTGREVSNVVMGVFNPRERGYRWLNISAVPLFRHAGEKAYQVYAVFADITERKRAQEALRESEARLHSIASTALDAVIMIDHEGNVTFWNNAAAVMFGYANEEITGKYLHAYLIPERHIDRFKKGFDTFRITGQGPFIGTVYEIEAKRKDGTEFPVELSLNALRVKGRWNAIGIVRDITERRLTGENLKRTMEELGRSNRELEQFAYAVSHDLQEPLRTVGSYVDLLAKKYKEKELDEKAGEYISYAIDGTKRMSTLITDLLAYSRVGTKGKESAPVEMSAVLQKATGNLKKAISEGQAVITNDELPRVIGDESQLVQLFQNLISNAIKFRRKDVPSRIHVSAENRTGRWVFGVHDNGIGIEPAFQERVFTVFQRLHTREEYPGTGIGLAICRRIVERHHGRLWLDSKPGKGSSFYFTLGLDAEKENRREQAA